MSTKLVINISVVILFSFSNVLFLTFHAVKEFLEKCKSEFEEKWNHPKHVSANNIYFNFSARLS